jgi:hypothetical protein
LGDSKKISLSEGVVSMPHPGHDKHLCYFQNIGLLREKLNDYKKLVRGAKFICKDCGRAAASREHLCFPEEL